MFLFDSLRSFLPKVDATIIDNQVFRLHYKVTVAILIVFVILVSSREYLGDPIACTPKYDNIPEKAVDQFCWVTATFSMVDAFNNSKVIHEEIPYVGVGHEPKGAEKVYHKYYQWVAFMLFMQATIFYIPRYMWKMWEGGKLKHLVNDLHYPVTDSEERTIKITAVANYFVSNFHTHNGYAVRYFICEALNLLNIIVQLFLTDRFLGWEFFTYGTQVLSFINMEDQNNRVDPMSRIFPRMTKCHFRQLGAGGGLDKRDVLCVLPLNAINEKIFIFLWFWFIVLAIVSSVTVIYRIVLFLVNSSRVMSMRSRVQSLPVATIVELNSYCQIGDWFVLYTLSKNMHHFSFKELVDVLVDRLGGEKGFKARAPAYLAKSNDTLL